MVRPPSRAAFLPPLGRGERCPGGGAFNNARDRKSYLEVERRFPPEGQAKRGHGQGEGGWERASCENIGRGRHFSSARFCFWRGRCKKGVFCIAPLAFSMERAPLMISGCLRLWQIIGRGQQFSGFMGWRKCGWRFEMGLSNVDRWGLVGHSSWHIEVCVRVFLGSAAMANHREGSGVFRACGLAMFLFSCKCRDDSMMITGRMFSRSVVLQRLPL